MFLTMVLLVGALGFYWTVKKSKPVEAAWYNASWGYRKQITVDKNKVAGGSDLSNFPMLFSVTDNDLKYTSFGGKVGKTDGTDILITSSDGSTKLSHQIDKYASSTGETVIWVRIPTLSVSTDTVLYIYFGNSGAADQQDVADGSNDVWDTNYKLVWHLGDGTTLAAPDATSNSNTGTVSGATATAGKIGGGGNFSGSAQEITRANTASIGVGAGDSTVSAWIYINAYASAAAVYDKGASGSRDYSFFVTSETSGHIAYGNSGGSSWTGTGFTGGSWHYLTVVQTGGVATIYLDGIQNFTKAVIVAANTAATLSLGGNPSTGGSYWNGKLDEFRVSGATRSVGWIQTEFINQSDPGSFYAYGKLGVQTVSSLPAASSGAGAAWYNASWAYRRQITIDHTKVATSSSLSNFPMLFSVTDSELKYTSFGGRIGKTDGTDILFTDSSGTKLNHEIEKYSSSTGETIVWVNVPTLSGATDTTLYMYYGNSGAADQQNATSTWDSFYKAVYHLGNGTTLSLNDSTTNAYNLTNNSTVYPATGKIDGGASATSTAAFAKRSAMGALAFNNGEIITVEAWAKRTDTTSYRPIISLVKAGSASKRNFELDFNGGGVGEPTSNSISLHYRESNDLSWHGFAHNVADIDTTAYHHYVATYTFGTGSSAKLYVDGVPVGGGWANTGNSAPTTDVDTLVLFNTQDTASETLNGFGDEVRVSKGIARAADWVATEFNNQSDPASFYAIGATQTQTRSAAGVKVGAATSAGAAWYNASWTYRRQITIDHTKVATSSSLSNFPMLFSVTDSGLKYTSFGGRVGKTDGTDMLFTSSDGTTKLDHQLEKYASSTGETVAWVEIPSLSGTSDTVIYLYYGNSGAADQQNATGVWDANYKGVWHLPDGTTLSGADSITSGHTMTNAGGVTAASGKVDGAGAFGAASGYMSTSAFTLLASPTTMTFSAWVKIAPDKLSARNTVFSTTSGNTTGNWSIEIGTFNITNRIVLIVPGFFQQTTAANTYPTDGNWHYVTFARNGSGDTGTWYIDGVAYGTSFEQASQTWTDSGEAKFIGLRTPTGTQLFQGSIDEVRVSAIARTIDWIQTEVKNQSDPASFYSFGSTQTSSKSGAGGTGSAPAVKVRGQVKFR